MNNSNDINYKVFTGKQITDKAIHTLKGLLIGIKMDGSINTREVNELNLWADKHIELISKNPFREFINAIKEAANGDGITMDVIEDLYWLSQKYEGDYYYYDALTSDLQILQGICHGILADGKIHDNEIMALNSWLDNHEHLINHYPYDEIRGLLLNILSDKKIDENERTTLMAYFTQFVNIQDKEVFNKVKKETEEVKISGLCTSDPSVTFEGKSFCITGVLKRGNRSQLQNDIKKLGGNIHSSISSKTDYLVVGDNGNQAWAFSCYGRKVEAAMNLRKEGHKIIIIHEFDFCDILDDLL